MGLSWYTMGLSWYTMELSWCTPHPPCPHQKNIKVSPAPPRLEREPRPHARLPPGPRTLMFF